MKNIEFLNEKEVMIDGQKFVKETKDAKAPEFKIPGWYVEDLLFYAIRKNNWYLYNDCGHPFEYGRCRPATPQEIEETLINFI